MAIREKRLDDGPEGSGTTPPGGSTQPNPISPFRRALEDYTDALQSAWRPELAANRLNEAWRTAAPAGVTPAHPTDVAAQFEQQAAVVRKLQDAWLPRDAVERFEALFTQYVNDLKAAWAKLDAERVTPAELATIAATVVQAAGFLAVPLERGQQPGTNAG